ncbi:MAG: tetratricopeptide repeat protein [Anaerolineales bacterium]
MSVLIDLAQRFLCWLAGVLSPLYQWLNSGWRAIVVHLGLMAFTIRLADAFLNKSDQSWFTWQIVLGVFALTLIFWWALLMRKRVVIDPFVVFNNPSDATRSEAQANNLSSLLAIELLRLSELYQDVQGQSVQILGSALPRNEAVIKPAAYVEDVRDFLQNAISSDAAIGLGVFKVPVGALMGVIGRVLQGPHITGVLSYQDNMAILTARAGIQGKPYAWRVERKVQDGVPVCLDEMVAELACRMFTDLNLGGSVRWRATRAFNEGLRAYRDSLYTPHARRARLKEAEAHFLRALAEDEQFTVVYYNLGLVYHALDRAESAERCFQEALRRDPSRWEIYYALAYLYYLRAGMPEAPVLGGGHRRARTRLRPAGMTSSQLFEKVIALCKQANVLKPRLARACNLMGVAYRGLENLAHAVHSREQAVRFGRFDVLCETLRAGRREGEMNIILRPWHESLRDYTCNLAVAYAYQADTSKGIKRHLAFWKAMYFFRQALRLDLSFDRAAFESAKTAHLFGNYQHAIRGYQKALSLQPDQMEYRAYLARAYADHAVACAKRGKPDQALRYEQDARAEIALLLTHPSQIRNELYTLADACLLIQEKALASRLEDMAKLFDKLQASFPPDEAWLIEEYQNYTAKKRNWEAAQVLHALARAYELERNPGKAEEQFREAIDLLKQDGQEPEIRQMALNAWLALAMSRQGGEKLNNALIEAQNALREEPLAPFELKTLSNIYMSLQDYRAARDLLEKALLLSADDPEVYVFLGSCSVSMAQNLRNPIERTRALDEALAHLKGAVEMYDDLYQRGRLYYWMGKLYLERGFYAQAMENFRLARGLGVAPLLALHQMAWTALRQRDYQSCIQHCLVLIQELANTEGNLEDQVAPGSWDDTRLGELEASARLLLVYCDAERDANLHDALAYAYEEVAPYVSKVPVEFQLRYRAALADCIGWLQVKRGQLEEAINWLESSLAMFGSDAGAYVHLGIALARKLQRTKNPEEAATLRLRIASCIEHTRELDVRSEYEARVAPLEQILVG